MTRALLDVNVLLALFDTDHVDHRRAHRWLDSQVDAGWASCPVTQNGFVRIISQPRYPSPISPGDAILLLRDACRDVSHEFWPCDSSLLDEQLIDPSRLQGPRQVTDAYLLGLAVARAVCVATFDRSMPIAAVSGARSSNVVVL